jgi:amino acid adenylation domain-containing protein
LRYLLTHLIDAAAESRPQHPAMRCRGEQLTYGELAARANGLARLLIDDGVRPGDRVGILLPKCLESAVAVHGIMKAGAVYVPLDATAPTERLEFVIRDCGIERLITDQRKRAAVAKLVAAGAPLRTVVGLEEALDSPVQCYGWSDVAPADDSPDIGVTEDDLCYILYTSGSTGVPKGIMHTHESALAWARVSASAYDLSPEDRISNYAPLHFDLSTLDYFAGACAQCTTVILTEEHQKLPASLSQLLAQERLTLFYTVPFALIQLVLHGALEKHDWRHLRWVLFGGEPMPVRHLAELMRRWPQARFANVYGPTETNGCTHYVVPRPLDPEGGPLPIGRPYANADLLVADDAGQPVARGVAGELLVRAPTTMRGYWARPDLNDKVFFYRRRYEGRPECFVRTGDIVRENERGELEFHGRRDRLVKTRGYRVELDEVEAVLARHPAVEEAAAFAVSDSTGSVLIHAAVTSVDGEEADTVSLIKHVKAHLPPYARPAALESLPAFPRTTTGKIDRRALAQRAADEVPA